MTTLCRKCKKEINQKSRRERDPKTGMEVTIEGEAVITRKDGKTFHEACYAKLPLEEM